MRWSLNLGSIGGTAIRIHVTFLLFLIWLGAIYYRQGGAEAAWQGTIFIVLIFLCVLLHELGHVFAARYYGVPTRDVTLWPFGGIASMERMPDKPSQELVVALAGPAVNVLIAAGLLLWLGSRLDPANLTQIENPAVSMAAKVAGANIILVLFNMIPAFPMDGECARHRARRHHRPGLRRGLRHSRHLLQSDADHHCRLYLPGRLRRSRAGAVARRGARDARIGRHDHRGSIASHQR